MKEKFRRILKKSKFACAFPGANGSDDEGDGTTPQNTLAQNASHRNLDDHDTVVNEATGAELLQPQNTGSSSRLRTDAHKTTEPQADEPSRSNSRNTSEAANPNTDQHSSRNSLGRKRVPDEVYKYVREIDATNTFECLSCGKVLGKRNATRFKRHCIEKCAGLHTPIKKELRLHSKSRKIGDPKNRSRIGLALQRDNLSREEENRRNFDDEDAQMEQPVRKLSTGSRDSKVRKVSTMTTGKASSSTDPYLFVRSIMEFIILKGLPFNIFDSPSGSESEAVKMFRCRDPTLTRSDIPSGKALAGRELDRFHLDVQKNVKDRVLSALRQGYGSLIFDGWDDVNSSPVVNVLLRTEGNIDAGRRTFFLSSVYTGCKKSGANEYVSILEDVMRPYGGFYRICSITSDNASSCLNTRKIITEKHAGIVGVNDQSHVADLLMEDMEKLQWVKEILSRVSNISNELHNHRKLKARYEALLIEYNEFVKSFHKEEVGTRQPHTHREGSLTSSGWGGDRDPASLSGKLSTEPRTAIMLKQSSNTRFASSEGVLESFIRSLTVLRTIVKEDDFDRLFKPRSVAAKKKRDEEFVQIIEEHTFSESVRDVYRLLLVLRRYLRAFDGDNARITEVLPFTMELEKNLQKLSTTEFFTPEREEQVLNVYRRRRDGPLDRSIRVRLLEDIHYVSHMLDPNFCPDEALSHIHRFRSHTRLYALSIRAVDVDSVVNRLVLAYMSQRELWRRDRDGLTRASNLKLFRGNALLWWYAGNCQDRQLQEFAIRTLSCSPTSCAVERSFSAQKKLQPKQRNRLSQDKMQKMIFCYWNLRLMKNLDKFDKQGFWESVGNALRSLEPSSEENLSTGGHESDVESGDESSDDEELNEQEDPADTDINNETSNKDPSRSGSEVAKESSSALRSGAAIPISQNVTPETSTAVLLPSADR